MLMVLTLAGSCSDTTALSHRNESGNWRESERMEISLLNNETSVQMDWEPRGEAVRQAHVAGDRPVSVRIAPNVELRVNAQNLTAVSYHGIITDVEIRPSWPLSDGPNLANRIERLLGEWKIEVREGRFDELRAMGTAKPGASPGMWAYAFPTSNGALVRVRIQGVPELGWFAVVEIGAPMQSRPR